MKKRCSRFRHVSLTKLTHARERIGKSPYIFRPHRFRHMSTSGENARTTEAR